ncbi:CHAT domain-containing protein [Mycobacteroides salmoniphilum]|uniref:CHAT domain-containing protein n=1 Tax=Mycobacteroides salmoniphilum TaxID=404941 RepID=UPI00099374F3|nr:CHAT domain-containing protein [Mycobacteroides salmoniphilum]QCH25620.1 CHAT domain protein [Mycobacteroides salmoniphilum]
MVDVAVTDTLVLRFADVGVATYASLRVVGEPSRTITWVVEQQAMETACDALNSALPDPSGAETALVAIERALTTGAFTSLDAEFDLAHMLGSELVAADGWRLLSECVASPRAVLFVTPSPRLARVPWGQLAMPGAEDFRLMELADVLMAVPPNIVHTPRASARWCDRQHGPVVLLLDPRIPGQRPDSTLGSVLGRPLPEAVLTRHFGELMDGHRVLPAVGAPVDLFRRNDIDRDWLARACAQHPARLLYVGHASAAEGAVGHAERAALHLAEDRPLTAADMMATRLSIPPRVALLACSSGGDYRFDEATGLAAAMILGGAQLVTATLWSLPTAAAYRQFGSHTTDPMADTVAEVDRAHCDEDAGRAVNRWQRAQLRRWRDGDRAATPLHWAAVVSFAVDGAR